MITPEDRRKELALLLHEMQTHPSSVGDDMRERVWVLRQLVGESRDHSPKA
jgi:hypothetical protein